MGIAPRERVELGLEPGGIGALVTKEMRIPPVSQELASSQASMAAVTLGTTIKLTEGASEKEEENDGSSTAFNIEKVSDGELESEDVPGLSEIMFGGLAVGKS